MALAHAGETPTQTIDRLIAENNAGGERPSNGEPNNSGETGEQPVEDGSTTTPSNEGTHPGVNPHDGGGSSHEHIVHEEPIDDDENDEDAHHAESDYRAFYEKVTAPVRARGKQYQFTDADDVRKLISQGVDYTYKMQQITKDRGAIAIIRNAGINDDDLRALVDVYKGDAAAIVHFADKGNVDLISYLDIDEDKKGPYKPKTEEITPAQQAFQDALQAVQSDNVIGPLVWNFLKNLPESDLQKLAYQPGDISKLLEHGHSGVLQKVLDRMEQMYITGRLDISAGMLSAYNKVLQTLISEGAFAPGNEASKPAVTMTPPQPELPNQDKRRQVGPTRSVQTARTPRQKKGLTLTEIRKIKDPVEFQKQFRLFQERNS